MRPYLAIMRGSITVGLVYRFGFIFTLLGNVIYLGVAYYLWKSIYASSVSIHGMTFNDTFIYVALGSTVFILLKTYVDWMISSEIREGMITIFLARPVDYGLYALAISLGFAVTNIVALSIPTVLLMIFVFHAQFSIGPGLLLFPVSLLLAFVISFCFDYIIGLTTFYTESIWGLSITKEVIVSVLAGALIPLQFFPDAIQKLLLALPFQAIYYTPLMMVTRPNQDWPTLLSMLGVQVLWTGVLFVVARLYYNQAIKVLRVAGG